MTDFVQEDPMYMEHILDLYRHPHNFGAIDNPSFRHKESNPLCGDEVEVFVDVSDGNLREVRFSGVGCAICMASSSLVTDALKGKPLAQLRAMQNEDVYGLLGVRLSPPRVKCALLPLVSLRNGLAMFERSNAPKDASVGGSGAGGSRIGGGRTHGPVA